MALLPFPQSFWLLPLLLKGQVEGRLSLFPSPPPLVFPTRTQIFYLFLFLSDSPFFFSSPPFPAFFLVAAEQAASSSFAFFFFFPVLVPIAQVPFSLLHQFFPPWRLTWRRFRPSFFRRCEENLPCMLLFAVFVAPPGSLRVKAPTFFLSPLLAFPPPPPPGKSGNQHPLTLFPNLCWIQRGNRG